MTLQTIFFTSFSFKYSISYTNFLLQIYIFISENFTFPWRRKPTIGKSFFRNNTRCLHLSAEIFRQKTRNRLPTNIETLETYFCFGFSFLFFLLSAYFRRCVDFSVPKSRFSLGMVKSTSNFHSKGKKHFGYANRKFLSFDFLMNQQRKLVS